MKVPTHSTRETRLDQIISSASNDILILGAYAIIETVPPCPTPTDWVESAIHYIVMRPVMIVSIQHKLPYLFP